MWERVGGVCDLSPCLTAVRPHTLHASHVWKTLDRSDCYFDEIFSCWLLIFLILKFFSFGSFPASPPDIKSRRRKTWLSVWWHIFTHVLNEMLSHPPGCCEGPVFQKGLVCYQQPINWTVSGWPRPHLTFPTLDAIWCHTPNAQRGAGAGGVSLVSDDIQRPVNWLPVLAVCGGT